MRLSRILGAAASGSAVYVLVVACSGGGGGGGALADAMTDALGGGGSGGFLVDALTDPVSDAKAAPPEIKEAQCTDNGAGALVAEVPFPGRTVNELARASVIMHYTGTAPAGYNWAQVASAGLKDGSVYVYCNAVNASYTFDTVRVILPTQ